jgi:cytoskeletal protein CcmA (bactofilin family)
MRQRSEAGSPTMIIPSGTEIQVDVHGQLSIRTPGNLVIQSSGNYGVIESVGGSIRIETNAHVEAVTVRCAEICFIEGSLTAWKVAARAIHLEESARAHIVLQETEQLEVGRGARLVGNFSSEKELFLLFSRFAQQFRSLPLYFDRRSPAGPPRLDAGPPPFGEGADDFMPPSVEAAAEPRPAAAPAAPVPDLPDPLFFALVLLERDAGRGAYGPTSQRVLEQMVQLLRDRELEAFRHTYRTLFNRVLEPGEDVRRAQKLVAEHFTRA